MRRRILSVAMRSVLIAVLILGLPLGVALERLTTSRARAELEALALRASVTVPVQPGDPPELPRVASGQELAVYDVHGHRTAGSGPKSLEQGSRASLTGHPTEATIGGDIVEVVPVSANERVYAVVRAATEEARVRHQVWRQWAVLLGGCLLAGCAGAAFAARASRRLATPVSELAALAERVGDGEFAPEPEPSGVAEVDTASRALSVTARRLGELLERERSFARTASHQLRTPLTRLQLELEAGLEAGGRPLQEAAESALETAEQLSQTIEEVLALARDPRAAASLDVVQLAESSAEEWRGLLAADARPLRVHAPPTTMATASPAAVRQILHVLLDNAYQHGSGAVSITVRSPHGAVALDVSDEGGLPTGRWNARGVGLQLANDLAEANGARILMYVTAGVTRATVLLPGIPD
ncbi:sensor histidine kinase [Marmoricola sp. RAF53]|uniref:sensor histidine kinase n=1 Tax=Marmoricola sp. RAF53 TaxID=3233059 RepID=UPI003F9A30D1